MASNDLNFIVGLLASIVLQTVVGLVDNTDLNFIVGLITSIDLHSVVGPVDNTDLNFIVGLLASIDLQSVFFLFFADRPSQYIYLNINQLDALNCIMSLFHASTCFEHKCPSSGGQNSSLNLCTGQPPIGVMIPETV